MLLIMDVLVVYILSLRVSISHRLLETCECLIPQLHQLRANVCVTCLGCSAKSSSAFVFEVARPPPPPLLPAFLTAVYVLSLQLWLRYKNSGDMPHKRHSVYSRYNIDRRHADQRLNIEVFVASSDGHRLMNGLLAWCRSRSLTCRSCQVSHEDVEDRQSATARSRTSCNNKDLALAKASSRKKIAELLC